jgi:molecular chaperone DnaJ
MPKYLSVNQRTIIEMLADEMGDKNAKRVMNLGQYNKESKTDVSDEGKTSEHQDEGFLKNMWHNISGQHKAQEGEKANAKDDGVKDEEPKK